MAADASIWNGGTNQFDLAGNWVGGNPIVNEIAVIKNTGTGPSTNMTAFDGIDFNLFYVEPECKDNIGGVGNAAAFVADTVEHRGEGAFHFKNLDTALATRSDFIICHSPNLVDALNVDGEFEGAVPTTIRCKQGKLTMLGSVVKTAGTLLLITSFEGAVSSDAIMVLTAGGPVYDQLDAIGGITESDCRITLAEINRATVNQMTLQIDTGNIRSGGRLNYTSLTAFTTMNVYGGGVLNLLDNENHLASGTVNVYDGGVLLRHPELHSVTVNLRGGIESSSAGGGFGFGGGGGVV